MQVQTTSRTAGLTIALCFVTALFEGFDIQAAGIVAPLLTTEFHIPHASMGWLLSASTLGLLFGAIGGGWTADRVGRRPVLIGAISAFGACCLATALANSYETLVLMRLLTGLGLGAAMPNVIALTAEVGDPAKRAMRVTCMYSGIPIGAAAVGLFGVLAAGDVGWRMIFVIGGIGPLVLAAAMIRWLPESQQFTESRRTATGGPSPTATAPQGLTMTLTEALFGSGRSLTTSLLWVVSFFTLMAMFLMVNWLPTLFVEKGYTRAVGSAVSIFFNIGGAIGAFAIGLLIGRHSKSLVLTFAYGGIIAALVLMALLRSSLPVEMAAGFVLGFFLVGGQFVVYGLSPGYYPTLGRGSGVGAAIAVGRCGAIIGPIIAGELLSAGYSATSVILAIVPVMAIACVALFALTFRPTVPD